MLEVQPVSGALRTRRRTFRVFIVLPVFNEEASLRRLLEKIDAHLNDIWCSYQIVVVNDGSTDRTGEILDQNSAELPLLVHTHVQNQGLGAAIRDGLFLAAQMAEEDDIIVTMDADETHTPGLILRLVRMVREGYDVVIASRYQPGSRVYGLTLHRRMISWLGSWLLRVTFPTKGVRDYTCGYRAYRASALKKAVDKYGPGFVDQDGFQCMVDILLKLRRLPLVFGEAPLILRYDMKKGDSKMRLMKTAVQTLGLLVRTRLSG